MHGYGLQLVTSVARAALSRTAASPIPFSTRRETVPHALFFSPPLPPIEPQPGLKMDLCIHDVRAYLDFTRQRASQREVRRGSAVALGWCTAELIGVEQKAALM